jgi:predicted O-methyltransferase YrrM
MTAAAEALLERIYTTGKVEDAEGNTMDALPHGVPEAHAKELTRLVRSEGAESTLETGMAVGCSTLAILAGGTTRHVAIDPYQSTDWRSTGWLNVCRAGAEDRVRLIEERADAALPKLVAEGLALDLALVDGQHLFDYTLIDFFYIDRMLRTGGIAIFHDTWMPAVAQVVDYVLANRAYERVRAGDAAMAVLRRTGDDDRRFDFHRDFLGRSPRRRWAVRGRLGRVRSSLRR